MSKAGARALAEQRAFDELKQSAFAAVETDHERMTAPDADFPFSSVVLQNREGAILYLALAPDMFEPDVKQRVVPLVVTKAIREHAAVRLAWQMSVWTVAHAGTDSRAISSLIRAGRLEQHPAAREYVNVQVADRTRHEFWRRRMRRRPAAPPLLDPWERVPPERLGFGDQDFVAAAVRALRPQG